MRQQWRTFTEGDLDWGGGRGCEGDGEDDNEGDGEGDDKGDDEGDEQFA